MYQRKTYDEWEVQGNYGFGYECVAIELTKKGALQQLKCYRENEMGISFRIVKKRVKKG